MKPLLERQRRARINRCLESLRELMVVALQTDGHNVSRLEKADVLELTVKHLHKIRAGNDDAERYRAGFGHCVNEVSKILQVVPGMDNTGAGTRLMNHLGLCMQKMDYRPSSMEYTSQQLPCEPSKLPSPPPMCNGATPTPMNIAFTINRCSDGQLTVSQVKPEARQSPTRLTPEISHHTDPRYFSIPQPSPPSSIDKSVISPQIKSEPKVEDVWRPW